MSEYTGWEVTEGRGDSTLDVSVNVNALGVPETVKREFRRVVDHANRYPDPDCQRLPVGVYGGYGNFLLLETRDRQIRKKLLDRGVKVRDCAGFYGLDEGFIRVVVGGHADNMVPVGALGDLLG